MLRAQVDGIDLDQDMGFQRREWLVQRVGWVAMGLILVAALLGLLGGPGLLSAVQWGKEGDVLWVEGRRVERQHRPTELEVHFGAGAGQSGRVEFWVSDEFVKKMKLEKVVPEPVEMRREGDRVVMVIAGGAGSGVKLEVQPEGFGPVAGGMGVVGSGEVEVRQWVMP
jgi:hypothetical protein